MSEKIVIGVDLGGTNVRACAYYEDGSPASEKFSNPSNAQEGTQKIFDAISSTILQASSSCGKKIDQVGMAIPGFVDDPAGVIRWAPNFGETVDGVFRYWENVNVREAIEKSTGIPLHMGNDANLAALGEYRFGSGKAKARCLVMLTVGTGIGGGVVFGMHSLLGQPAEPDGSYRPLVLLGGNQGGAELGHAVFHRDGLDCNTGAYGAIEGYCRRDAIVRRAQHRIQRGRKSIMRDLVQGDISKLTPRHISEAAEKGDDLAIEVYREVGTYLGNAIGSFINVFAPDIVAIGGQIAKSGEFLLGPARLEAQNVAIPALFEFAKIQVAEQIDDAGLLGGAALAHEATKWN